jgi:hypothetical protein
MSTNVPRTEVRSEVESVPIASREEVPITSRRPIMSGVSMIPDRTRWGPIWAGLVMTFSIFLVLEALLFWLGGLSLKSGTSGVVVNHPWITWVLALVAFFIGGIVASSTSAVRGMIEGMLNGLLVWALATSLFAVASFFGAGVAAGTIGGLISRFLSLNTLQHAATIAPTAISDLRAAAGWALLTLVTTAVAAALGGWLGSPARVTPDDQTVTG